MKVEIKTLALKVYKRRHFHLSVFKHSYVIISTKGVRHLVAL
jgi:hypothetical protein